MTRFVTPGGVKGFAILFVLGAVMLTLLDSVHVHTHTLAYSHPVAYGQAWWVPLLFGCAASFGGVSYVMAWKRLGGAPKLVPWRKIVIALVGFALMYAASGLLPATATTKLIVIVIGAAVIFFEVDNTRVGAILLVVGTIAGPIAEAINPNFHYLDPDFLRIPVWLPAVYSCATPAIGQLARRLL